VAFFDYLVEVVCLECFDVVVVVGDVYDCALFFVDIVVLLDDVIVRFFVVGTQVLFISGNYDSAEWFGFGGAVFERGGVYLCMRVCDIVCLVFIDDEYGSVVVYGLFYFEFVLVVDIFGAVWLYEVVLMVVMDCVRVDLVICGGACLVVVVYVFVVGGEFSDFECDISVGGVGFVLVFVLSGIYYSVFGYFYGC